MVLAGILVGLAAANVLLLGISVVCIQNFLQGSPTDVTPLGNLFGALVTVAFAFLLDGAVLAKVSAITESSEGDTQ